MLTQQAAPTPEQQREANIKFISDALIKSNPNFDTWIGALAQAEYLDFNDFDKTLSRNHTHNGGSRERDETPGANAYSGSTTVNSETQVSTTHVPLNDDAIHRNTKSGVGKTYAGLLDPDAKSLEVIFSYNSQKALLQRYMDVAVTRELQSQNITDRSVVDAKLQNLLIVNAEASTGAYDRFKSPEGVVDPDFKANIMVALFRLLVEKNPNLKFKGVFAADDDLASNAFIKKDPMLAEYLNKYCDKFVCMDVSQYVDDVRHLDVLQERITPPVLTTDSSLDASDDSLSDDESENNIPQAITDELVKLALPFTIETCGLREVVLTIPKSDSQCSDREGELREKLLAMDGMRPGLARRPNEKPTTFTDNDNMRYSIVTANDQVKLLLTENYNSSGVNAKEVLERLHEQYHKTNTLQSASRLA